MSGLFLLPGAIDPHAHFEDPGHTEREDFTTGTMSAAAGGITTVIEHPLTYPPVTTAQLYIEKREMAKRKVVVDFGLWGALTEPSIPEIAAQWREGAAGFKAFMPFSEPAYPHVTDAQFLEGMYAVREVGGLVLVHAESDSLLQAGLARMQRGGQEGSPRPPRVAAAVRRGGGRAPRALPRRARRRAHPDRPRLEPRQRRARAPRQGRPASLDGDLPAPPAARPRRPRAPRAVRSLRARAARPPARGALWDYVLDGTADSLVSDHAAYTLEEKEPGWEDIFAAPLGCQVMQETVPLVLDEAYHRRGMTLDAFVRFSSTNAARTSASTRAREPCCQGPMRTSPSTTSTEWVVDARTQQFSKNPWSPFDGRRARARVVRTLVRGETVFVDGEIVSEPGSGRFLSVHDDYSLGG